jgi:hypothetical protein
MTMWAKSRNAGLKSVTVDHCNDGGTLWQALQRSDKGAFVHHQSVSHKIGAQWVRRICHSALATYCLILLMMMQLQHEGFVMVA